MFQTHTLRALGLTGLIVASVGCSTVSETNQLVVTSAATLAMTPTTNIGQTHYVEYHSSPSAWMTTDIFSKYVKRLNASFRYAKRNVAILVDNASVHKLKEEFSNIKLIFLPANTTSKLQPLDAGSTSNYSILF